MKYNKPMSLRFIVIDDAPFVRELIKSLCEPFGAICVGEAKDGNEAVELFRKTLPDLVFIDLVMPYKNGFEVLTEFKDIWDQSVVIGCTSVEEPRYTERALSLGCHSMIKKPFSRADFERIFENFFPAQKEAQG